jgi:hypothetical protein
MKKLSTLEIVIIFISTGILIYVIYKYFLNPNQKAGSTGTNNIEAKAPTGIDPSGNPYNVSGYGLQNPANGLYNGIDSQVSNALTAYLANKTQANYNLVQAFATTNGFVWSPALPAVPVAAATTTSNSSSTLSSILGDAEKYAPIIAGLAA